MCPKPILAVPKKHFAVWSIHIGVIVSRIQILGRLVVFERSALKWYI